MAEYYEEITKSKGIIEVWRYEKLNVKCASTVWKSAGSLFPFCQASARICESEAARMNSIPRALLPGLDDCQGIKSECQGLSKPTTPP